MAAPEGIPQSATLRVPLKAYSSTDHITDKTGLTTLAVVISKNGAAFGNPSAGVTNATEVANGWYYVDLSTTDTGSLGPLIVRATASGTDNVELAYNVVGGHNGGFDGVPAVAAGASGGLPTGDASGRVNVGKFLDQAVTLDANNLPKVDTEDWKGGVIPAVNVTGVPKVDLVDVLGGAVPAVSITGVPKVDVQDWTGTAVATPLTAGVPLVDLRTFVRVNTAQTGTQTTTNITLDAAASAVADFYKGMVIYLLSGTGAGQARLCTAYNGVSKSATITPAWATNPDNTSVFAVAFSGSSDLEAWEGAVPSALQSGKVDASVGAYQSGQAPLQPTTAGRTLDVAATGEAGLDFDNIHDASGAHTLTNITVPTTTDVTTKTGYALISGYDPAKTAAQAGDAMALTTGERTSVGTAVWATTGRTLTAFGFTVAANLTQILGTALTEGAAGRLVAAFKKLFDVATPVLTAESVNQTGDAYLAVGALNDLDAAGVRGAVGLASANLDTQLAEIEGETDGIATLNNLSQADVRTAVGMASADLDTQLSGISGQTDQMVFANGVQVVDLRGTLYGAILASDPNFIQVPVDFPDTLDQLDYRTLVILDGAGAGQVRMGQYWIDSGDDTKYILLSGLETSFVVTPSPGDHFALIPVGQANVAMWRGSGPPAFGAHGLPANVTGVQSVAADANGLGRLNVSDVDTLAGVVPATAIQGAAAAAIAAAEPIDANVVSVAADAIADAGVAPDLDTYAAKLNLVIDGAFTVDRYTVSWFKNSTELIEAGITLPTIQVWKESDGSDLIAVTAMTEIGSHQTFEYEALTTERIADGQAYQARVTAMIDGDTRVWLADIGRDA